MRQGGKPQGVQVVRQGEPTPYHCNFNRLYRPATHPHTIGDLCKILIFGTFLRHALL
nr:hypothetical protein [uncultured Kingella sp.]